MVARVLAQAGKKVVVLEARDRIGGRIYPLSEADFGYEAAGGAEFIHGEAPVSKALAKEVGLTLYHPQEWWSVRDGEPMPIERLSAHDPLLESKLRALTEDISVAEFLRQNFPQEQHAALWDFVTRWTEGYDAADTEKASTFGLREEMLNEGSWLQMNIKEGYGPLIKFLKTEAEKHGAEFILNKIVTAIDYTGDKVKVSTSDGLIYQTTQVILTVPLPILPEIQFAPAIPTQLAAAAKIGYGGVIKLILKFKDKWWTGVREQVFEKMFFMLSSEPVPTWWTQYPQERPILTGWLPGPEALEMSKKSDEDILALALESLSKIFTIGVDELKEQLTNYKILNWPKDPYARGVYSYATPWSAEAIAELQKPIANKVYLAGEAIYEGSEVGTVEAALTSGQRVAKLILSGMVL